MFKKKLNIKPLAPLRSSDRRKIADEIIANFNIEVPGGEEQDVRAKDQGAAPLSLSSLRNSLLPENALSARFTTTAGPDLKQVSGTLYAGALAREEQRILWFRVEERLLPTVYTLWRHPQLVPLLHTQDFVLQKLRSGAPLMTPGLTRGPPFPKKAVKDAIVAVASLENPSIPRVVGICEIDVATLKQVQGAKGHAVRSEHWEGDELWGWSSEARPGGSAPDYIDGWDLDNKDVALQEVVEHLDIEYQNANAEGGGVSLGDESNGVAISEPRNEFVEGEDGKPCEEVNIEEKDLSVKEIDDTFWDAFLYGIYHHRHTHNDAPHNGLNFPIHQSLVISNLVLPFLPIFTPSQAASLQIKKTSWKTAKKFIKALDKKKLLRSKDRDGGECVVLDIDFDNEAVTTFKPYKLPKKDTVGADSEGGDGGKAIPGGPSPSDPSIGQKLNKIALYRPKDSLSPLFTASNASLKNLYLPSELRLILASYIDFENLISSTNKRLINLNPILANALFNNNHPLDHEVTAKGTVPRDALLDCLLHSCSPFHCILRNSETRDTAKPKAGHAPHVTLAIETRSGNKVVTKVSGVEAFHISPTVLADELQKTCASSTSVGMLSGSSPKNPVMEVMVQGPQREVVVKALERRGLRREWVDVVDKTKGKKK